MKPRKSSLALLAAATVTALGGWALLPDPGHRPNRVRQAVRRARVVPERHLAAAWKGLSVRLLSRHPAEGGAQVDARAALARLGVPAWHRAGHAGRGVKVAVLDSGFRGYKKALGKALPAKVTVKSFRADGDLEARDSQHGILCAEVIHTIAPEAELLFANWEADKPAQFLEAVRWARAQGAQVLSCSVIMPTWSDGEGGGPTHRALAAALGAGGKQGDGLMFASAGNTALRHWGGAANKSAGGWHDWGAGRKDNEVRPYGADRVSVELYAPGGSAFEVVVRDTTAGREVGRGQSCADAATSCAAVAFDPVADHRYAVRVRPAAKAKGARFHLVALGGKLRHATRAGSVPFPADGAGVVAVGAVDGDGRRCAYSSCGPNSVCPKPDLVSPVPFPCAWRPGQPFGGTSAAAPQAAGLAALVWGRHPGWGAARVRQALRDGAGGRHSAETGYGAVRLW